MVRVICVGDNCIDYYEEEKKGYPGGNPVNVAVYVNRLGQKASYMGVVGDDEFGNLMIDAIASKGVDISHVSVAHGSTPMTMVSMEGNERILGDYFEGVFEDYHLTSNDIQIINDYDLMVTGIWSKTEDALQDIQIPIAFDFADKMANESAKQIVPLVTYGFYSDDNHSSEEIKADLSALFTSKNEILVCTRGDKGSIAYDGKQYYEFGIYPCEVVDTLGAGDSYIAAFLLAIMAKKSILEAMEAGAKHACQTIGYRGAW